MSYMPIMNGYAYEQKERLRELRQAGAFCVVIALPMEMLTPHEAQARANHNQTLNRLAERGGLTASEAIAILKDRGYVRMPHTGANAELLELFRKWEEQEYGDEHCIVCYKPMVPGDLYYSDADGGVLHAACCGPERESYTNAAGDPLGPDDPVPEPMVWEE